MCGDVRDEEHHTDLIGAARDAEYRFRGLVNNAGCVVRGRFEESELADLDLMVDVNFRSAAALTYRALPHLDRPASLVHIASIAGSEGRHGLAGYTASKAALIGWSRSIALELGNEVRSNCISPGEIATRMTTGDEAAVRGDALRGIPGRRTGHVDEVAKVVQFLLSDDSAYVNGTVVPVDGGETAGGGLP